MTAPTKANASTPASPDRQKNGERPADSGDTGTSGSQTTLEELAGAQAELTHEIRQLVARQALDDDTDDDGGKRADRMVTVARAELLEQLREQEQEQARRQLAQATRSSEDAVDGVVRSVTRAVGMLVPAALVRPEDLIEAAYVVADQGLRVSRRLALSVSSSFRSLATSV